MISPKKAKQFMELAEFKANLFSKDEATQVCAIIVAPGSLQELSSGWNGIPRGVNESIQSRSERPAKYHWYEHAERNAIYNASRRGTPLEGSIMFINRYPCSDCARAIIQCGIKMIITVPYDLKNEKWLESWRISEEMLAEVGIPVLASDMKNISHVVHQVVSTTVREWHGC
jgi:dCMP deaminase